jgi:hypothetical protein
MILKVAANALERGIEAEKVILDAFSLSVSNL